jgi:hypothetical protein
MFFHLSWNLLKHLAVAHNLTLYNAVQIQGTEEANDLIDESQEKQSEELQADQDQPGLMETDQTTQNIL